MEVYVLYIFFQVKSNKIWKRVEATWGFFHSIGQHLTSKCILIFRMVAFVSSDPITNKYSILMHGKYSLPWNKIMTSQVSATTTVTTRTIIIIHCIKEKLIIIFSLNICLTVQPTKIIQRVRMFTLLSWSVLHGLLKWEWTGQLNMTVAS